VQPADAGSSQPFRWDLVRPDQLGSLLDRVREPDLWFAAELTVAAGLVLARSGGGDMYFVGRSADSMFDLLSGALSGTEWAPRLHRLPFSSRQPITAREAAACRDILRACGITPQAIARSHRPIALVDLVSEGGTFTNLYHVLREWVDAEREPWSVIRRKLHVVGIVARGQSSPNAYRWQQQETWPAELPARAVVNVPIDADHWYYFGNEQVKLTRSYHPARWTADEPDGPRHGMTVREALAEAVALVELGRGRQVRSLLARTMAAEPAYAESWLRTLVRQLG
jgi:hypothetical protein